MTFALDKPAIIKEAAAAQKGMNIFAELGVFALVFLAVGLGEVALLFPASLLQTGSTAETLAGLFATIAMIVIVMLFCKVIQKRRMRTLGFVREHAAKEYLKGLGFGFLMFTAAVLICVFTGSLRVEGLSEILMPGILLLFVVGFLIQGMAEEVMLRGYLMVSIGRRYSVWMAVLVNALLFAALHLLNNGISVLAVLNIALFGVFASVYFLKSGNIWGIGACHSMWNLVQGNFYGIQVSGIDTDYSVLSSSMTEGRELINGGAFGLEGGLAVTIVLVVGLLILFWKKPAAPKPEVTEPEVV